VAKKYIVSLTAEEHSKLLALLKKGKTAARKVARANILLLAHEGATDDTIAASLHIGTATVERTRKKFVDGGLDWALTERPRPGGKAKLDGKSEAFLVALACSAPPAGRAEWTMQLLADQIVEIGLVPSISDETVRRVLKKTNSGPGLRNSGAFPKSAQSS
jgi:transposase